ncbi:MAG: zinc metalloprotease HtpX [Candidatus Methanoperedens sp.]|nr:zinc metalloprotease HtpX [Candidatus Methanoperedens sp.]
MKKASLITLGILSGFVFTILAVAAYFLGEINAPFLIIATIVFNFIMWAISPIITDLMMRFFYKIEFLSQEELMAQYPEVASFMTQVCRQNKIKVPKIGIIDDDNPTAFTYGSVPSNARMVFSKGLFTYLNLEEQQAVFAHEIGHIVHYDFVVMTVASTLVQILYEIYVVLSKTHKTGSGGDGKKAGGSLAYIGLLSYVFYFLGTYILLYLSRMREYYADEFSAKTTGKPNSLSMALIRIAYGIVAKEDSGKSKRLMESTRALGILDIRSAKGLGAIAQSSEDPRELSRIMAFDFFSPWANILELGSTHPLTGKRIERLNEMAQNMSQERSFDIRGTINSFAIDKSRLYNGFYTGVIIYFLPYIAGLIGLVIGVVYNGGFGLALVSYGIAMILQAFYRFPGAPAEKTTIRDLMSDIYASPIRGRKVALEGKIIGRGEAGASLSEDLMFQDNGGLVYMDYNSSLGFLGNLFFALSKIKKIIGQAASAEGWFFRGIGQMVTLDDITVPNEGRIKSYPKLWIILSSIVIVAFGVLIL